MANYLEESGSSLEDSEDLDDIPLSLANGRHEDGESPITSRGIPLGFNRLGHGFNLKLPTPKPEDLPSPGPEGLKGMRSEPAYLMETARIRPPLTLSIGPARTSYNGAAGEEGVTLLGRRGSLKPPMLSLINPASASPVPSGAPTPAVDDTGTAPLRPTAWPAAEPARHPPLRVDLVSSAFVLQGSSLHDESTAPGAASTSPASIRERIAHRCSSQLGIAFSDLEFFELRPLEGEAISNSCTRVGVLIRGSTFSLSALEDLLARSKRDSQLTTMLDGALRESSQHAAEAKQHAEKLAKQNEDLALLRERLRNVEAVNQHLREQLQRSDEHRQLLGSTIRTIKKEFEDFKSRVVVEGSLEQLPMQQLNLGSAEAALAPTAAAPGVSGSPATVVSQGQARVGTRVSSSGTSGAVDEGGGGGRSNIVAPSALAAVTATATSNEDTGRR